MTQRTTTTHEQYLGRVRDLVVEAAIERGSIDEDEATKLSHAKLVYGVGNGAYRGICYYDAWENGIGKVCVVEIAATAEESWVQLAGTVIHELGHVLAGHGAGHGKDWKAAAVRLGFTKRPAAAGQVYHLAMIERRLRHAITELAAEIADGRPGFAGLGVVVKPRPCSAGIGSKGGTSRGTGSGSRLRLWECECTPKPVKVRVASDDFKAHCDVCGHAFERK